MVEEVAVIAPSTVATAGGVAVAVVDDVPETIGTCLLSSVPAAVLPTSVGCVVVAPTV